MTHAAAIAPSWSTGPTISVCHAVTGGTRLWIRSKIEHMVGRPDPTEMPLRRVNVQGPAEPSRRSDVAHRTCIHPGCDLPHCAKGLCKRHWQRQRLGRPMDGWARKPCSIEGCSSDSLSRGWCEMHYARWKRNGDPLQARYIPGIQTPESEVRKSRSHSHAMLSGEPCYLDALGYCSVGMVYVHHLNENPLDNRPENLRPLCMRHHMLVHRSDFDLENPDHSAYYVTARGTLRRRRAA